MTVALLVRHGETQGNLDQVWHGSLDAPLTVRGQAQVAATALRVKDLLVDFPIDRFYVSPLPRARSTADAIARMIDLRPEEIEGLREFDLGDWEGRTFQDLRDNEQLWQRWSVDSTFAPPNGESPHSFSQRAMSTVNQLVALHPDETILIVSHSGVITQVLANWLGEGPDDWRRWEPENCAISILARNGSTIQPILVNDVSHLAADLLPNSSDVADTDPST